MTASKVGYLKPFMLEDKKDALEHLEQGCLGSRLLCLPDGTVLKPLPDPGQQSKSQETPWLYNPLYWQDGAMPALELP